MKVLTDGFQTKRNLLNVYGVWKKIELIELSSGLTTDITEYVTNIGVNEHRLEDLLNEPIVAILFITVKDKPFQEYPFFTSGGTTGLFDKITSAAISGYQVKITTGITGEADIILVFDGELDVDTIDRFEREKIEFSVNGWLKEADDYNAEEIADPDNPPFRNICGITFVSATGYTGAKEMKYGIEGATPYLQYENGEKILIYSAVNPGSPLTLWDAVEENSITINYGTLPTESKSDKFTIINHLGSLWACRWYENIKLETIVGYLFDHLGITTQDINVREIETGTDKHFVYLTPFFTDTVTSDMEISAVKVVNYDVPTKTITMLIGIQEQLDADGSLWKIDIDLVNWTYTKTELVSFHTGKVLKLLYFNGRTWAIRGLRVSYEPLFAGLSYRWYATKLYRLAANWASIDRTVTVPNNVPSPDVATDMTWDILLGNTCSCNDTTQDMYALRQYRIAGILSVDLVKYNDAGLGGWIVVKVGMEEGSGQTQILADDYGTFAEQQANDYFYYGCRWFFPSDRQYVVKYDITGNAFVFSHQCNQDGVETKCMNFVWEKKAGNECYVFMKYLEKNDLFVYEYANWWFRDDGTFFITYDKKWQPVYNRKYLYSNQTIREKYYTQWYINDSGQWFIQAINAENGLDTYMETVDFLHYGYEGITSAPQIFKQGVADSNHHFAGCLVDTNTFAIVPYVYTDEALSTVHIADFTGYSCRDALKYLAEANLDVLDIYERDKARFYYRETNLGSTTFNYDIYKKQPQIELWVNRYDGIVIENSGENLRWRFGNTDYGANVLKIDNRFISEGIGGIVGLWMYDFFNTIKRIVTLEVPYWVEMELMDKVALTLRDMTGGAFWNFNTLVYEMSFDISSMKDTSMMVNLKLLEIGGTILHAQIVDRRVITV